MTSFSLGCLQDLAVVSSFCSWGPCSQGEIHTRSRARSFSPFVERQRRCKVGIKPFSQCSQIKVEQKEMPALLIDFSFASPGTGSAGRPHVQEIGASDENFSSQCFSCSQESRRTPSLLSSCLMVYPQPPRENESSKQPFKHRVRWELLTPQTIYAVTAISCHNPE